MSEILVNTIKKADGTGSLTVPADTGTVLTSATALSNFPSGFANGITVAGLWRITANVEAGPNSDDQLTANWEEVDTYNYARIGSAMTESSGTFSFPETGIYKITFRNEAIVSSTYSNDVRYVQAKIFVTTDNSTYNVAAEATGSIKYQTSTTHGNAQAVHYFDVTNTSTHKVRFHIQGGNYFFAAGSTSVTLTFAEFERLGDT